MLDAATLAGVDRVLRTLRRQPLMPEQPFGGLQVIFVGDFFQLPPVTRRSLGEGGRNEQAKFAFESPAWKEANPVICYLSEQHRQEDGDFLDLLSAMRRGAFTSAHRTRLSSRIGILSKQTVATRLYTHNENVDRINMESLGQIEGKSRVFEMSSRGARALVESLKAQCLSPETLELKEGASVMFTRNNFDAGYVNGTLGTLTGFSVLGAPVVQTRSGATITAEPAEWAIQDGNRILAKITQVPLRLARCGDYRSLASVRVWSRVRRHFARAYTRGIISRRIQRACPRAASQGRCSRPAFPGILGCGAKKICRLARERETET